MQAGIARLTKTLLLIMDKNYCAIVTDNSMYCRLKKFVLTGDFDIRFIVNSNKKYLL